MPYNARMFYKSILLVSLCLLLGWLTPAYAEPIVSLKLPLTSLEKWYKPANKRQVWLHTMFRLRREMQAIADYAENSDSPARKMDIAAGQRLQQDC